MKKFAVLTCTVAFSIVIWACAAWAHGGSHHQKPGYTEPHGCNLSSSFHHYDHQNNYGTNKNIWCDGTGVQNALLGQHHAGQSVNAALPGNASFVGGFCIKSQVGNGEVLEIHYQDVVRHDGVWLQSNNDGNYYPIDIASEETSILVEDNGWADKNQNLGQIESEVLFSSPGVALGGHDSGGSGGCNSAGFPSLIGVAPIVLLPLFSTKK
jgi:hypothetical protein